MTTHCARRRAAIGFTLLELLVVVLIIGLLTGIVGPRLMGQIGRSEVTARVHRSIRSNIAAPCGCDCGSAR